MPVLIWQYFHAKAKKENTTGAYQRYRAILYYLNQVGYEIQYVSPAQYARSIDSRFNTSLLNFNTVYQKLKYSSVPLTQQEQEFLRSFYKPFVSSVRKQIPFKVRCGKFLNIMSTLHYFSKPKLS